MLWILGWDSMNHDQNIIKLNQLGVYLEMQIQRVCKAFLQQIKERRNVVLHALTWQKFVAFS